MNKLCYIFTRNNTHTNLQAITEKNIFALFHAFGTKSIITQIDLGEIKFLEAGADDVQGAEGLVFRSASNDVTDVGNGHILQSFQVLRNLLRRSIIETFVA